MVSNVHRHGVFWTRMRHQWGIMLFSTDLLLKVIRMKNEATSLMTVRVFLKFLEVLDVLELTVEEKLVEKLVKRKKIFSYIFVKYLRQGLIS